MSLVLACCPFCPFVGSLQSTVAGSPPPLPRACRRSSPSRVAGHSASLCPPPAAGLQSSPSGHLAGPAHSGHCRRRPHKACSPLPAPRPRPPRAGAGFSHLLCSLDHSDGKPHRSGEQGGDAEGLSASWGTLLSRPVVLSVLPVWQVAHHGQPGATSLVCPSSRPRLGPSGPCL